MKSNLLIPILLFIAAVAAISLLAPKRGSIDLSESVTAAGGGSSNLRNADAAEPRSDGPSRKTQAAPADRRNLEPAVSGSDLKLAVSPDVIYVGELRDPDDPSSWPRAQGTEVIRIGSYRDPNDPASWPDTSDGEVRYIGPERDPLDPMSWPASGDGEPVNIGPYRDPDDLQSWSADDDGLTRMIGEYKDPDDFGAWPEVPDSE